MHRNLILLLLFTASLCSVNAQVNLTQGLVAYYPFHGNANDLSGNGNHGTPMNGAQLSTDRAGLPNGAFQFDGVNDYISIPNSPSLNPANAISIAMYFNPSRAGLQTMLGKISYTGATATQYSFSMDYSPYPGISMGVNSITNGCSGTASNSGYVNTISPVTLNTWHCVVATFDNGVMKIYLNGTLIRTTVASFNTMNQCSNATLQLGMWWSGDPHYFQGKLDDIRIYNRALNPAEVNALCSETIINEYTPAISLDVCKNILNVENGAAFNPGDTVLLIQMKGAGMDSTNSVAFGNIIDYKNCGNYEFNFVKSRSGNNIELLNKVVRQYDLPNGSVQLVRVPYFQNYTVTQKLTCLPWDGRKGGVLAFNVQNNLSLAANIDVSGKGFKGGAAMNTSNYVCNVDSFFVYDNSGKYCAPKGEGIYNSSRLYGRGKLVNGGGGGNSTNAGGAGGGNGGTGGSGGKQYIGPLCNNNFTNGGIGGSGLNYSNAVSKIFLGGGGGAGHGNENLTTDAGNGAGIVLISANTINANAYKILANGATPLNFAGANEDGRSGGGAGGTVLLAHNALVGNLAVEIKGGNGDYSNATPPLITNHGPGGGGGGGVFWTNKASIDPNLSINVSGGINGTNINWGNDPWGATPGSVGQTVTGLLWPIATTLFKPNIDSVRIDTARIDCSRFNFNGLSYTNSYPVTSWQWYFGDGGIANTQNTSHTYSTTGTYPVKLVITDVNGCKDSITVNVTTGSFSFDFNYSINPCSPLTVQFNGIGTGVDVPDGDLGDGSTWTGQINPLHTYGSAGNYLVQYYVTSGPCRDTIRKTISIGVIQDNIVLAPDTTICFGTTKQILTAAALGFCWTPTTWLDNPNSPQPTTSTPQSITYYYTAEVTGTNLITNSNFSSGNSGFTSEYNFASSNTTEGQYYVGTNPNTWHGALNNCVDHTTGNGNMLMINGAPVANVNVWKQTLTVTPNTNYAFSTWVQSISAPNPAQLQFSINSKDLGTLITASVPACNWTQFYTTWNSGANTTATISIVNKNTQAMGNDFALDDISFAAVYIKRDSVKITVDTAIVVTSNDFMICAGQSVQLNTTGAQQYSWSPVSGLSNSAIGNPTATPTSSTQYVVSGTNVNGCVDTDTVNVNLFPAPQMTISNDTSICRNSSVQLFATGGISYSWTPVNTLNNPSISNPVASPVDSTKYYVNITDAICTYLDSVQVNVLPPPVFSVNANTMVCLKDSVQLNASGGDVYSWQPSSSLTNGNISNPLAFPTTTTTYSVTITETTCNLSTTLTTEVSVNPLPVVTASKSNDIDCSQDKSQLTATGANQYSWLPSGSLNNPLVSNPIASPGATTQYIVKGTDLNGCESIDTVAVNVDAVNKGGYLMPTAFTPNNDGLNDCYRIKYWGVIYELEFSIYNRWGERIFYSSNPDACWDGTYKGVKLDAAVFVYVIKAKTNCQSEVFRKGTFALIR